MRWSTTARLFFSFSAMSLFFVSHFFPSMSFIFLSSVSSRRLSIYLVSSYNCLLSLSLPHFISFYLLNLFICMSAWKSILQTNQTHYSTICIILFLIFLLSLTHTGSVYLRCQVLGFILDAWWRSASGSFPRGCWFCPWSSILTLISDIHILSSLMFS